MSDRVNELVREERNARHQISHLTRRISDWHRDRRDALHALHKELGTWQKVADATGQKVAATHKAARTTKKETPE